MLTNDVLSAVADPERDMAIDNGHIAPIFWQAHVRPPSFSEPESHVNLLNLTARKPFLNVQIKADQTEYDADWPGVLIRGLHGERVYNVLQNESRSAHRIGVHLVICGTHGIHIER